jgi:hypothetical protein
MSHGVRIALLAALPEKISGGIYELGSGWGQTAFSLSKKYPQNKVTGYELSWLPYLASLFFQRGNLKIERKDFFSADLGEAGLIVCYLYPKAMEKLKIKLKKELKPGTVVASSTFAFPELKAEKIVEIDDLYKTKIYIYRF